MTTIGFGWDRKTVARVLKGQRRIHVDEVYALAVCLETTATILIAPIDRASLAMHGQTPNIEVGLLPAILPTTARGLFSDEPTELLAVPPVAVVWESDISPPRWRMHDEYGLAEMVRLMTSQLEAAGITIPEDTDQQAVIDLWNSELRQGE
jgi:hypothetical protein